MAWVARYMTDRFISRSRSQPAAASGALQHARALAGRDAPEDGRAVVGTALGQQVDPGRQVAVGAAVPLVKEHDRLAELDPIAGVQGGLVDGLAVDERAVRRAQIDDPIPVPVEPELGVAAGNLGVVEPYGVRAVPAQGHGTGHELEPLTLVGPLDDEQGGHEAISPRLGFGRREGITIAFSRG